MARPLRILWAGGWYHVMSRGDVLRGAARGSTPGGVGAAGGRGLGYQAAAQAVKRFGAELKRRLSKPRGRKSQWVSARRGARRGFWGLLTAV